MMSVTDMPLSSSLGIDSILRPSGSKGWLGDPNIAWGRPRPVAEPLMNCITEVVIGLCDSGVLLR